MSSTPMDGGKAKAEQQETILDREACDVGNAVQLAEYASHVKSSL